MKRCTHLGHTIRPNKASNFNGTQPTCKEPFDELLLDVGWNSWRWEVLETVARRYLNYAGVLSVVLV